jgi:CBS domain-containing protein
MRAEGVFLAITRNDALALFRVAHQMAVDRLRQSVLVRDLMTTDLLTLTPDMDAIQAVRLLAEAGISGAPVMRAGVLVGIVSIKDFLPLMDIAKSASLMTLVARALCVSCCQAVNQSEVTVASIMTAAAKTVAPDATAFAAAQIMAASQIRRLPVLEQNRLVGMLSHSDLIRAFGDMLTEAA